MNEKQKELAARKLCELKGVNADKQIGHGAPPDESGFAPAIMLYSPAWKIALQEIEAALLMENALAYGREN